MPSHRVHIKWSKRITGTARPDVDKFLDDFAKDIDVNILRECISKCRETVQNFTTDEIEELLDYYREKLGINIERYNFGLIYYMQLDPEVQTKLAQTVMRTHDSWRFFDYCTVIEYIERKFGKDGAKVAVVHILLDEIARLAHIDYADARKGATAILACICSLQKEYLADIVHKVNNEIDNIIIDVSFSIGINFLNRRIKEITIIEDKYCENNILKTLKKNLKDLTDYIRHVNTHELSYNDSYLLYKRIKNICRNLKIKTRILFDKISGKIVINNPAVIVTYTNGKEVVYPHVIGVYPVGEVNICVEDLVYSTRIFRV